MNQAEQWLANYNQTLAQASESAQVASEHLRQVSGTASSPRGEVSVQVGPSGALEDLKLTPGARALEAEQLARLIVTTAQEAQRAVGAQVVEIMTDYVGDGPALDIVKQNMPPAAGVDSESGSAPGSLDDDDYFAKPPEVFR